MCPHLESHTVHNIGHTQKPRVAYKGFVAIFWPHALHPLLAKAACCHHVSHSAPLCIAWRHWLLILGGFHRQQRAPGPFLTTHCLHPPCWLPHQQSPVHHPARARHHGLVPLECGRDVCGRHCAYCRGMVRWLDSVQNQPLALSFCHLSAFQC